MGRPIRSASDLIGKRIVLSEKHHLTPKQRLKRAWYRTEQNKIVGIKQNKSGIIIRIYVVRPNKTAYDGNFRIVNWKKTRKVIYPLLFNQPYRRVKRYDGWKWETTLEDGWPTAGYGEGIMSGRQNGSGGKAWRYGGCSLAWFLNNPTVMEPVLFPRLDLSEE